MSPFFVASLKVVQVPWVIWLCVLLHRCILQVSKKCLTSSACAQEALTSSRCAASPTTAFGANGVLLFRSESLTVRTLSCLTTQSLPLHICQLYGNCIKTHVLLLWQTSSPRRRFGSSSLSWLPFSSSSSHGCSTWTATGSDDHQILIQFSLVALHHLPFSFKMLCFYFD